MNKSTVWLFALYFNRVCMLCICKQKLNFENLRLKGYIRVHNLFSRVRRKIIVVKPRIN